MQGYFISLFGYFVLGGSPTSFGLGRGPITPPNPAMVRTDRKDLNSNKTKKGYFNFSFWCLAISLFFSLFCHFDILRSTYCIRYFATSIFCLSIFSLFRYFATSMFCPFDIMHIRYFAIRHSAISILWLINILRFRYFAFRYFVMEATNLPPNCNRYSQQRRKESLRSSESNHSRFYYLRSHLELFRAGQTKESFFLARSMFLQLLNKER